MVVCMCLSLSFSLASTPGSFVHCVLIVRVYVWVWPGVGNGVSGEFSHYYSTRGWGRLRTRSPFDTSSPEHSAFVTYFDLFWFPHWFVRILCFWLSCISLKRCYFVLSKEVDLNSTSFVWFCWHQLPLYNAVPREITVNVPWPMNGV